MQDLGVACENDAFLILVAGQIQLLLAIDMAFVFEPAAGRQVGKFRPLIFHHEAWCTIAGNRQVLRRRKDWKGNIKPAPRRDSELGGFLANQPLFSSRLDVQKPAW